MAEAKERHSFGMALGKLRACVVTCAIVFGLAVFLQTLIFGFVTGMDWHYQTIDGVPEQTVVISPADQRRALELDLQAKDAGVVVVDNRVPSVWSMFYRDVAQVARAAGMAALLVMFGLVAMSVLMVATTACPSVDRMISALVWTFIITLLALPLGNTLGLSFSGGVFYHYPEMQEHIAEAELGAGIGFETYARFLVLPGVCVVGTLLMLWRFNAGIEPAIERRMWRLDAELEAEASNIKVTSLHGVRGGTGLNKLAAKDEEPVTATGSPLPPPPAPKGNDDDLPSARAVSAGSAPKRII